MNFKKSFFALLGTCVLGMVSLSLAEAPRVVPAIVDSVAHERGHFTQGLFFDGKELVESTGRYGASGLYRHTMEGTILDSTRIEERYFGEGSVAVGDDIFFLTWKSRKAFIYSRKPFVKKGEFRIPTDGWGLTYWKNALLMSNGSNELLQMDLGGFNVIGVIPVTDGGKPAKQLNELEVVGDTLYANVWQTDEIAVIELPSGKVLRYLDLSQKVAELYRKYPDIDVLNGIAYDGKNLWITGKYWPWIYKIKE